MTEDKKYKQAEYTQWLSDEDRSRMESAQAEAVLSLGNRIRFCYNVRTRECIGDELLSEVCPISNGQIIPIEEWIYRDDLPEFQQKFDELLAGKLNSVLLDYRTDYFGALHYYRVAATLVVKDNGEKMITGAVQDITRNTEKDVKSQVPQSYWGEQMDTLPILFFVKDTDLRYLFANRRFQTFTGHHLEDIVGKTDEEIDPAWAQYRDEELQTFQSKDVCLFENQARSATGETRYFHTLKWQDTDADGRRVLLGISIDETARRLLLDDLKLANKCMSAFFDIEDDTARLRHIMELFTRHLGASHCIVTLFDKATGLATCMQEYVAPGKGEYLFLNSRAVPFSVDAPWYRYLMENTLLAIPNVQDPEAINILGPLVSIFHDTKIKQLYSIAVQDKSRVEGSVCFLYMDDLTRPSEERMTNVVSLASLMVQGSRSRKKQRERVVSALKQSQNSDLAKQIAFLSEKTVRDCLEIMLKEGDLDVAWRKSLKRIFDHLTAQYGFYFTFHPERSTMELKFEYAKDGKPILTEGNEYPYVYESPFEGFFKDSPFIAVPDLRNNFLATSDISPWKDIIAKHHLTSLYTHQVTQDGHVVGFFVAVYANIQHHLNNVSPDFIGSVAHCLELLLERQRNRDALIAALDKAQAANSAKDYFIASISHEIRTPLNAIVAFADVLDHHTVSENEICEYRKTVKYWSNVLIHFFDDLLDLVQADTGSLHLSIKPTNLNTLCEETFDEFQNYANSKGIAFDLNCTEIPYLMLDRARVRQILFTVLDNAIKYTERGSVMFDCSFAPKPDGLVGTLTFIIRDTGIGMSREDRNALMEPFARLSTLRGINSANSGTGLGASLVKKLIRLMNGTVDLKSELGKGTEVRMVLHDVEIARKTGSDTSAPMLTTSGISKLAVLLVDDVLTNLKVLNVVCSKIGMTDIVAVESGAAALAELRKRPFDLVLTDMRMPKMTGEELVQAMREDECLCRIPAIAVTADINMDDNYDMTLFSGQVLKPVTKGKILNAITATMNPSDTSEEPNV